MRTGEMGNAMIAAGEMGEDAAASGIGQGSKRSIQGRRRIFNHMVNYLADPFCSANDFFSISTARLSAADATNDPRTVILVCFGN